MYIMYISYEKEVEYKKGVSESVYWHTKQWLIEKDKGTNKIYKTIHTIVQP